MKSVGRRNRYGSDTALQSVQVVITSSGMSQIHGIQGYASTALSDGYVDRKVPAKEIISRKESSIKTKPLPVAS